ncbi:MAG: PQQ-dependent sugar dehydrogenase [Vicinamibacterales bacterium]
MFTRACTLTVTAILVTSCALAQNNDPFPTPIATTDGVVRVGIRDFATVPDSDGAAPRLMLLLDEPGTRRLFVSDMKGLIYSVSYDGKVVTPYLDLRAARWNLPVQSMGAERGLQSFAFHPQFGQQGTPGYGRLYTYLDTSNQRPAADFLPASGGAPTTHDTVLVEWIASDAAAASYEGSAPREVIRLRQPFANHNGGHLAFNPLATPEAPDFGLLYMGIADGGNGGDPMRMAQNLASAFGKIVRIDPLGSNSANRKYGIPSSNPFVGDSNPNTLGEIYAYGVRNPQRFAWDARNGNMYMSDIGQNIIEEVSQVWPGRNRSRAVQCGGLGEVASADHQREERSPRQRRRASG